MGGEADAPVELRRGSRLLRRAGCCGIPWESCSAPSFLGAVLNWGLGRAQGARGSLWGAAGRSERARAQHSGTAGGAGLGSAAPLPKESKERLPVGLSCWGLELRARQDVFPSPEVMRREMGEGLCSRWMLAGPAWVVSRGSWLHSLFTQDFVVQEAFRAAPELGWGA